MTAAIIAHRRLMHAAGQALAGQHRLGPVHMNRRVRRVHSGRPMTGSGRQVSGVALSPNIRLDERGKLKYHLSSTAVEYCNRVAETLRKDQHGFVVDICQRTRLHWALQLHDSPAPQGNNEAQSMLSFTSWLKSSACSVPGVTEDKLIGDIAISNLNEEQASLLLHDTWQVPRWNQEIVALRYKVKLIRLYWLMGTGAGKATLYQSPVNVFC
ncbi:Uncharacterized protein PBTT_01221 [Plasmodiophora brassicae]|uniref:Uncharacterized protein n=1 Tax=Plasmodiophora brassicae TaxID=37360 RepID=A0A0G4IZM4_PLABS|nr:hypothetical protein PBRA_001575 [Plasmodiophora brassicae]SPQ93980.1 unnamed protein product [Plasmodiophora brassicae]